MAGLPLLWAGRYVPSTREKPRFGVVGFAFVAPLLALACFVVAFQDLAITSLMPVYGLRVGMSESSATLMLFFGVAGGALLQFPIGWAADHFESTKGLSSMCSCRFGRCYGLAIRRVFTVSFMDNTFSVVGTFCWCNYRCYDFSWELVQGVQNWPPPWPHLEFSGECRGILSGHLLQGLLWTYGIHMDCL